MFLRRSELDQMSCESDNHYNVRSQEQSRGNRGKILISKEVAEVTDVSSWRRVGPGTQGTPDGRAAALLRVPVSLSLP